MAPLPKVDLKGLGAFLHNNKMAMVFLFILLLAMIMMDTRVTMFGTEFGFTSSNPCFTKPPAPILKE